MNVNEIIALTFSFLSLITVKPNLDTTVVAIGSGISYFSEVPGFTAGFDWDRIAKHLVACLMFWRWLFVLLTFFSSRHCLSFIDLRVLVTSLVWLLKLDNWLELRQILIVLIIMDIRQMFRYRIYTTENTQNIPLATNRT